MTYLPTWSGFVYLAAVMDVWSRRIVGWAMAESMMGVPPSMGSVGDACDNAMAESFFATLECELIERRSFQIKTEAKAAPVAHRGHQPRSRRFGRTETMIRTRCLHAAMCADYSRPMHNILSRQRIEQSRRHIVNASRFNGQGPAVSLGHGDGKVVPYANCGQSAQWEQPKKLNKLASWFRRGE